MGRVASWMGQGLLWAGTLLLIVISIPLLVVLVVLLRPILVAVAAAGLATVPVLAICSRRFREWFCAFCQQPVICDRDWYTLRRDFFDTPSVLNRPVDSAPSAPL